MAGDSLSMGEDWEARTVGFDRYVSWIERISNILLTLNWVALWKLYTSYDLSVNKLILFNTFVYNFWCPLFIITTTLRLFCWILRVLCRNRGCFSDHDQLNYRRWSLERCVFYIERIGMFLLRAPYSVGARAIVFQFGCCAIPCLVLFPFANLLQLIRWVSDIMAEIELRVNLSNGRLDSSRISEELRDLIGPVLSMFFPSFIFGLNHDDDNSNGELKKTNATTDPPPANRLDLNDDDDHHHHRSNIPDLVDSGELKITPTDAPLPSRLDLSDDDDYNIPDLVESEDEGEIVEPEDEGETMEPEDEGETVEPEDEGETVEPEDEGETVEPENEEETVKPEDEGETDESEDEEETDESEDEEETEDCESDKAVISESEGSFVMLEFNKDEEEEQNSSTVEPREEEQTETILEGKLGSEEMMDSNEQKLEKELEKMGKSVENLERSFGELMGKLSAAADQAEFYRLQAQESNENLRKSEEDKTNLIIKLAEANANASSELFHTILTLQK